MKVLFVASEASPFIKTGGLGDVMGALPPALKRLGLDVKVVLPKYKNMKYEFQQKLQFIKWFTVKVGWRNQYCGVSQCEYNGVTYYFLDNEYYFGRDGLYGFYDDAERFAFFDRAVMKFIKEINWQPDIIIDGADIKFPIRFYNNDRTKKFRIIVEGMTSEGKMLFIEKTIAPATKGF